LKRFIPFLTHAPRNRAGAPPGSPTSPVPTLSAALPQPSTAGRCRPGCCPSVGAGPPPPNLPRRVAPCHATRLLSTSRAPPNPPHPLRHYKVSQLSSLLPAPPVSFLCKPHAPTSNPPAVHLSRPEDLAASVARERVSPMSPSLASATASSPPAPFFASHLFPRSPPTASRRPAAPRP
jgi:hypothetical protein